MMTTTFAMATTSCTTTVTIRFVSEAASEELQRATLQQLDELRRLRRRQAATCSRDVIAAFFPGAEWDDDEDDEDDNSSNPCACSTDEYDEPHDSIIAGDIIDGHHTKHHHSLAQLLERRVLLACVRGSKAASPTSVSSPLSGPYTTFPPPRVVDAPTPGRSRSSGPRWRRVRRQGGAWKH